MTVIKFDHLELVECLLERGASPNVAVDDGYTCLLSAIDSEVDESVGIVAALIAAGADIHRSGVNGWTPLHLAAARGHTEKARLLLEAGADVDRRIEIDGEETPLMEAAYTGQAEIVRLLLDHGADASLRETEEDRTPLEIARYAAAGPDPDVYELLKDGEIQVDLDEMFDEMDLSPDELAALKEHAGGIDMAESYLENAREVAESGDHAQVIRLLEEHEARR